jgi:hypothetical protein
MKYAFLLYGDDEAPLDLPPEAIARGIAMHEALQRDLGERLVDGHRLRPRREATTVRRRGDALVVTDGPFAEAKEQLAGFYLIEAGSLDEAVAWCHRLPPPLGTFEVRPAWTGAQWRGPLRGKSRFLLLLVADRERLARQTPDDVVRAVDHHYELSLVLAAQGRFAASRSLGSDVRSKLLRRREGETVVLDGPYAEAKEVVAGYFLVACDTRDEAVEIAKQLSLGLDAVEVRPIWEKPYF